MIERCVLVSGKICSGKSTLAELIVERNSAYRRVALADSLKDDIAALPGVGRDRAFIDQNKDMFRTVLQLNGTEIARRLQGEDYWVERLVRRCEEEGTGAVVVDDARFPNEVDSFRPRAAQLFAVRLEIDPSVQAERYSAKYGRPLTDEQRAHPSETSLDDYRAFDATFDSGQHSAERIYSALAALRPDLFAPGPRAGTVVYRAERGFSTHAGGPPAGVVAHVGD
jgi:hypothetical protein